jgi:hypothetical protein
LWLNPAELELSAPSLICFSRRIGYMEELDRELQSPVKERNRSPVAVLHLSSAREAEPPL